jgi:uncharacterized YigZ family protein
LSEQTDTYLTISTPSTGVFKDKGSKFLSFAFPVKDEKKIKEIVDKLKKEYFDARHHCYAYRLGANKLVFRANDDGEPSGTAGKPILGQIVSKDLTNILIVVVRYFGGTLLGTSGLINAYKNASADCISNAAIVQMTVKEIYLLTFSYAQMNDVMKVIKDFEVETFDQNFELTCTMKVRLKLSMAQKILKKLSPSNEIGVELLDTE